MEGFLVLDSKMRIATVYSKSQSCLLLQSNENHFRLRFYTLILKIVCLGYVSARQSKKQRKLVKQTINIYRRRRSNNTVKNK